MSIKDYSVRLRTKGKTRGRPSKLEMTASAIMSWQLKKNQSEITKAMVDMFVYGTGAMKITPKGIKRVSLKKSKLK